MAKTMYPLAWHEDRVKNLRLSAEKYQEEMIRAARNMGYCERKARDIQNRIDKAKAKGKTELPSED